MAQTIFSGPRDVQTAQDQIIPEQIIQNSIDLLTINDAPWTAITRAAKKHKPVGDNTYYIYQKLLIKGHTLLTAAVAVAAGTWNVSTGTGAYIKGWDILWNRTRNTICHVKSVSSDAITVLYNADSGTDTAGVTGDEIVILGNAIQEAGAITQAKSNQEVKRTNYIQDIVTAVEFSDLAKNSFSHFSKNDYDQTWMEALIVHQRSLERTYKFNGKAALLTTATSGYENPDARGTTTKTPLTMGFHGFMNTYADSDHIITEQSLTEFEFLDSFEAMFYSEYEGSNKKKIIGFVPEGFMTGVSKWNIGRGRFTDHTSSNPKRLGLNFKIWDSPYGPIELIIDHEMTPSVRGNQKMCFFVDRSRLGYTPYNNMDTHVRKNAVKDAEFRDLGYVRTVGGTFYTHENSHVVLKYHTIAA